MVSMPLVPSFSGTTLEPGFSLIGMALNGVPAFGPQEGGGTNAVEGADGGGVPYYGHAAPSGDWHYHSGEFGAFTDIASVPSTQLIGYAMDGFPIYGSLTDNSVMDECNGVGTTAATYRYHIRTKAQVNEALGYCNGTSPAINWPYTLGCFKGDMTKSAVVSSTTNSVPSDCVLVSSSPISAPVSTPVTAPASTPVTPPASTPVTAPASTPITPPASTPITAPASTPVAAVPTLAPIFQFADAFCFSGDTTLQVEGKGPVTMKNLKIGDSVLTASGTYEPVFSFGHRHDDVQAEFLQFLPSGLEISPDHMVLIKGVFVPASLVTVGDALETANGKFVTIEAIKSVVKKGVYAPFTMSGTLVVNNVIASNYVSFYESDRLVVGGWETHLSFQWIAHLSQSPYRLAWRLGMVGIEEYTVTGVSTWVSGPHEVAKWVMVQHESIMVATLMPVITVGLVSTSFENAVSLFV